MREMAADFISEYKAQFLRFGGDRNDPSIASLTPEQAMLEEVRRSTAMVRFLEERIAMWNLSTPTAAAIDQLLNVQRGILAYNAKSMKERVRAVLDRMEKENADSPAHLPELMAREQSTGFTSFTDAREWLYLYREERAHLARVAKMCIDAQIEHRLVTLAEDQGRILATALRAVLGALSLTDEQWSRVPQIVPPVLRAVANDQPVPDISTLITPAIESP